MVHKVLNSLSYFDVIEATIFYILYFYILPPIIVQINGTFDNFIYS